MNNDPGQTPLVAAQAKPASDPAVRSLIAAAMLLGFGVWCLLDLNNPPYAAPSEDINQFGKWLFNHGGAIVGPIVGLFFLVKMILHLRRKLKVDASGITAGGRRLGWDSISQLDATRFKDKGLLTLKVKDGPDVVVDAWLYQKDGLRDVVRILEQKLPVAGPAADAPAQK